MQASTEHEVLFDSPGPVARRRIRLINRLALLALLIAVGLLLWRLYAPPQGENQLSWQLWQPALELEAWTDFYLPGLWLTLKASALAVVGSVAFGFVFGVGRLLPNFAVRWLCAVVIEFCRAVPVLIMMIFFWRAFAFAGLQNPSYWAVVLALTLYNGSVVAELIRAGVGNLPAGQREASMALGLSRMQSLVQVEVPQAVFAMLPAAVTQLVVVLKDTALGSIIMYTDLLQESRRLGSMYFNMLQTLTVAAVLYFIVCYALSCLAQWLPAHLQRRTAALSQNEAVAPIAIMDPSNANQIAVAQEVKELPLRGTERHYHVHHRGTNASIHHWRQTRYVQGYDQKHPGEHYEDMPSLSLPHWRQHVEASMKQAQGAPSLPEAAADTSTHADISAHGASASAETNNAVAKMAHTGESTHAPTDAQSVHKPDSPQQFPVHHKRK